MLGAKTGSVRPPLRAILRGRFQPYFGERGDFWTYFPQELKKSILRGLPGSAGIGNIESEPDTGVFSPRGRGLPDGDYPHPEWYATMDDIGSMSRVNSASAATKTRKTRIIPEKPYSPDDVHFRALFFQPDHLRVIPKRYPIVRIPAQRSYIRVQ